ncbi:MAG TPA: cytochrome b/b6 domain-containing protein [Actinophytocola sp.]|uniref:cytochrome b/b6 domain-containing protein n=1 Tax=Actinophytocola sp. TaxID=1872138 RepID=UPI002DDD9269|nr:cytochrome b/b6 domain-containing protein [Actinophytocola sp.]HEV2782264.1 cytochrome b/b6 domain-containing protein [Actinophytocola sp.]
MATERSRRVPPEIVRRNNARTRWFHAGVYLTVLVLLFTGWWLTLGEEGEPSVLSELFGIPDTELHTNIGWVFAGLAALGVVLGWRAAWTLVVDSVRFRRSDLGWFARWPAAVFTGRFGRHEGHFDPGQRIMNVILVGTLLALIVSGVGLVTVSGGPEFVLYNKIHRWSTYLLTPALAGHIIVASGVLPGYHGAWRAMHLGGRLRTTVARRLWPAWLERQQGTSEPEALAEPERKR